MGNNERMQIDLAGRAQYVAYSRKEDFAIMSEAELQVVLMFALSQKFAGMRLDDTNLSAARAYANLRADAFFQAKILEKRPTLWVTIDSENRLFRVEVAREKFGPLNQCEHPRMERDAPDGWHWSCPDCGFCWDDFGEGGVQPDEVARG